MRRLIYTLMACLLLATSVVAQEATPEATPEIIPPTATPNVIPDAALPVLVSARTDIEVLANSELGSTRPTGWSGSLDINDANLALLLRLDLELLVGKLYSLEARPDGWFGAVAGSSTSIARDIRHDLELLADTVTGVNVRPPGWSGGAPIMRCDRATQTLVDLLEGSGFVVFADPASPNFCDLTAIQASQFAEANFFTAVPIGAGGGSTTTSVSEARAALPSGSSIRAAGDVAFAFLNRYATQRVGTIPEDVLFVPVARSYTQFSHMTLVQGDQFEVFVDYKTTTLTDEQFDSLPNVNDYGADPVCEAEWCHDPIDMVSIFVAPSREGQQEVNAGDNIVIYYDGGDDGQTTLVRMELCPQRTSVSRNGCQPVTTVIRGGAAVPSTGQAIDGIPQYRLPVRYSLTSARTRDFYTTELWIAPVGER